MLICKFFFHLNTNHNEDFNIISLPFNRDLLCIFRIVLFNCIILCLLLGCFFRLWNWCPISFLLDMVFLLYSNLVHLSSHGCISLPLIFGGIWNPFTSIVHHEVIKKKLLGFLFINGDPYIPIHSWFHVIRREVWLLIGVMEPQPSCEKVAVEGKQVYKNIQSKN